MYVESGKGSLIRLFAGIFVLASVLLGYLVSPYWFLFTGFVGLMLIVSSLTGFCPMEYILRGLGVKAAVCRLG